MELTPELAWHFLTEGYSVTKISESFGIPYPTVVGRIDRYAKQRKVGFINGYVKPPPYLNLKWVRPDIDPTDYSDHNEYSKHFAGAEYEDTRPPEMRGMDWPPKVEKIPI